MRIAVIGSRDYPRLEDVDREIDTFSSDTVVVSGGARGVDRRARDRAQTRGLAYEEFPADWDTYGKRAGILRNEAMIVTVDRVVAFWDEVSPGTAHAIGFAESRKIPVETVLWSPELPELMELVRELRTMYEIAAKNGFTMSVPAQTNMQWLVAKGFRRLTAKRS